MHGSGMLEGQLVAIVLIVGGALLVAGLAWALGRVGGWRSRTDEIGELAWLAIRHIRRLFVVMAAATLALVGSALLVLPGPGLLLLAAALALLASEFVWARRWIRRLRTRFGHPDEESRPSKENDAEPPET